MHAYKGSLKNNFSLYASRLQAIFFYETMGSTAFLIGGIRCIGGLKFFSRLYQSMLGGIGEPA